MGTAPPLDSRDVSSGAVLSLLDYAVPSFSGMMDKKMLFYKGLDDHRVFYSIKKAHSIAEGKVLPPSSPNFSWARFPPGNSV